jgi:type III secretion system FlhB-like substrate exporter
MARRFILSDDLTGNESEDVKGHLFMVDNVFYEVDFSGESFDSFEKALAPFIKVMRETRRITATAKGEASKAEAIRQWAKANGLAISERGRMSDEVIAAYEKAHDSANSTATDSDDTVDADESTDSAPEVTANGSEKAAAKSGNASK